MPGKPEEPGPTPQSGDTDCSQSRDWDHQGCLGHFQEGQECHFQVLEAQEGHFRVFPQYQYCGPNRISSKDSIRLLVTCVTSYNFVSLYTKNRWVINVMGSPINVGGQCPFITFFTLPVLSGKFLLWCDEAGAACE